MLPDGLADADLVQAQLPILDILACKATLIRTALAFVGQDQHLKVLVPIREHILHTHPPANALKLKLREHFHQILDLWNQFKNLNVADIHPQISQNLGNFNTVLHDGLESEGPDIVQNFRSILFLNHFYDRVQDTYSPLLLQLSGQMLHWKDNQIFGEYLIRLLEASEYLPDLDFNSDIILGTQYFTSKDPLEQSKTQHNHGPCVHLTKFITRQMVLCSGNVFQDGKVRFSRSPAVFSNSIFSGTKYWLPYHCWLPCFGQHMWHFSCHRKALECTHTCQGGI
jgi:hypothetical protein